MVEQIGVSRQILSNHLACLRGCGLVVAVPEGRRSRNEHPRIAPAPAMSSRHVVAIGGSDAGISAALRARELDPAGEVTVVVADNYPNYSICGIPYHLSGEVGDWRDLAHRSAADLAATGMRVLNGARTGQSETRTRAHHHPTLLPVTHRVG